MQVWFFNSNFQFGTFIQNTERIEFIPKYKQRGSVKHNPIFKKSIKTPSTLFAETSTCIFCKKSNLEPLQRPAVQQAQPNYCSHHVAPDSWEESVPDSARFHRGLAYSITALVE